jgi:RiboL-PSP-HEPN
MTDALTKFLRNLAYAKDLVALYHSIDELTTDVLDPSDLLRAALVNGVSALDDYVHTVVRWLMVDVADGQRARTDAFDRFSVPLRSALQSSSLPSAIWLDQAIKSQHAQLSFQSPDKIADAIRLVSPKELWNELAVILDSSAVDLKTRLKLIVSRRNQIVHEADCDPTPPHSRWPIGATETEAVLTFVEDLAKGIDSIL